MSNDSDREGRPGTADQDAGWDTTDSATADGQTPEQEQAPAEQRSDETPEEEPFDPMPAVMGEAVVARLDVALESVEHERLALRAAAESAAATDDDQQSRDERHSSDGLRAARSRARGRLAATQDRATLMIDDLLRRGSPYASAAWDADAWTSNYHEPTAPPHLIAVSDLRIAKPSGEASFPLLLPAIGRNVIITHEGAAAAPAHAFAQAFVVRALAASPPGSLRVHLLDPAGLGQNLGLLSRIPETLTSGGVNSTPDEVAGELATVLEHIRQLNTKTLLGTDDTLVERWRKGTSAGTPCAIVLAAGLPLGLHNESIEQLGAVARAGGRCGVSLVAVVDTTRPLGYGNELEDLTVNAERFHVTPDGYATWQSAPEHLRERVRVHCPQPPGSAQYRFFTSALAPAQRQGANRPVRLRHYLQREQPWATTTERMVTAVIGRRADGSAQELQLGAGEAVPGHGLLVGPMDSGKTTLLHGLIHSLAYRHSPEELELHLLDMKPGVEFAKYAPRPGELALPQVQTVGIETHPQFALDVLHHLVRLTHSRGELFEQAAERFGEPVADVAAYRRLTGQRMPRIVLVADELQLMLGGETEEPAWQAVQTLVERGPVHGVHLFAATRSLALVGAERPRQLAAIEQGFRLRIALRCPTDELSRVLGRTVGETRTGDRPGAGLLNAAGGAEGHDVLFQAAILEPEERASLRQHLARSGTAPGVRVSRGTGGVELSDVAHTFDRTDEPTLFLGAPVGIGRPTVGVPLVPGAGNGLLLATPNGPQAIGTICSSLVALAMQPFDDVQLAMVDLLPEDLPERRPIDDLAAFLGDRLLHIGAGRLDELADLRRPTGQPSVVAVLGLPHAISEGHRDTTARLDWLYTKGPPNGVHPLVWVDEPRQARQAEASVSRLRLRCIGGVDMYTTAAFLDRRPPFTAPTGQMWFRDLSESASPLLLDPFAPPSPEVVASPPEVEES